MNKLAKQPNSVGIIKALPNTTSKELNIFNAHNTSKRLKDFSTKDDLLLINSLITRWASYVGVNTPEAVELNTLANFIKEYFPTFNAYDLKECIGLITIGELKTDAEPYGKLSPIYVSKVLKAYQEYKMDVVFKVRESIEKVKQTEVKPISNEERINNFKKLLSIAYEDCYKGLYYKDAGDSIYNFIKYNKLVKLSKELIAEAMDFGTKEYERQKKQKALESVVKHHSFKSVADFKFEKEDIIKKNAREFVVNRWLSKVDLKNLLQKINIEMLKY
jgi:replicative superfamily II helicase